LATRDARSAALVTGASRGIGAEIARRLAAAGFDLTLSARSRDDLAVLAEDLAECYGITAESVRCDMGDEADVHELAKSHRDNFGHLDVLVLNAGMGSIGPLAEFPARRLDKLFAVNVRSAYVLLQDLLPLLRAAGSGENDRGAKVIALASTTGLVGEPLNSAYGATKAALISLCETLNTEESTGGITATAVCPGYVATSMTEALTEAVPAHTMLSISDVAEATVWLTQLSRRVVVPTLVLTRPGPHLWRA
jgi:short-subunit dehydrogenase